MLLPDLWREPLGPDPDGVRVLLLVGTGIFDELGCLAFNNPGGPEIEVFLELGLELLLVLLGVEVVGVLVEWHPTNTGMLDSDVDLIILLGRGVM